MASVIHSGWLLLLLSAGILLLLVGCATLNIGTSSENMPESPLVTLTVVPFSTPLTLAFATPHAVEAEVSLPPPEWRTTRTTSSGIGVNDPTCYNSPNQGFMCLGQVWNQTEQMLSNITLRVSLFGNEGQLVAESIIALDQHHLPPETSAPYRAQFSIIDSNNLEAKTEIETVAETALAQLPLRVVNEQGRLASSGRYVLTANVQNTSAKIASHIRLIATVFDEENRVVGYRVQMLESLAAGDEQSVRMEIIPQVIEDNLHHLLHVEAWNGE